LHSASYTISVVSHISCIGSTLAQVIATGTHDCILDDLLVTFQLPTTVTQNPPYTGNPVSYAYFATNGAQPAIIDGSDVNLISGGRNSLIFQTANWATRGNRTNPSLSQARVIDILYTVQVYDRPSGQITGLSSALNTSGPASTSAQCTVGCGGTIAFTNTPPLSRSRRRPAP
jgi:hypothetical protein